METTVAQRGQVTIPAEVRSRLGLKPRDKVRFEIQGDVVTLRPVPSKVLRWYGSVAPTGKPEDLREVREDSEPGVAEEVDGEDRKR